MSYMKPDPSKHTSCKNCTFAIYQENTQIGCEHGRIEKFDNDVIEAYDDDKEFFVINRLCNLFRKKSDKEYNKDEVRLECSQTFDLLVDVNDVDENNVTKIKQALQELSYKKDKYKLVFFHSYTIEKENKKLVSSLYNAFPFSSISTYFDKGEFLDAFIAKSKNTFHSILDPSNISGLENFVYTIDKYINDDLQKTVACKSNDKLAISNIACKLLYVDLYRNYDKAIKHMLSESKKYKLYFEF